MENVEEFTIINFFLVTRFGEKLCDGAPLFSMKNPYFSYLATF
jgi:hypothetical protein